MSLSTRIAIGPSRYLACACAAMTAGAIILMAATVAARLVAVSASLPLWLVAGVATVAAVAICAKRWIKSAGSRVYEVFISDHAVVSMRCPGEDTMPQTFVLTAASMVWPSFAVLSLSTSPPLAGAPASRRLARLGPRTLDLAVVRFEAGADDGWRLHRFLLWAQHSGSHGIGSDPRGYAPKDSLV